MTWNIVAVLCVLGWLAVAKWKQHLWPATVLLWMFYPSFGAAHLLLWITAALWAYAEDNADKPVFHRYKRINQTWRSGICFSVIALLLSTTPCLTTEVLLPGAGVTQFVLAADREVSGTGRFHGRIAHIDGTLHDLSDAANRYAPWFDYFCCPSCGTNLTLRRFPRMLTVALGGSQQNQARESSRSCRLDRHLSNLIQHIGDGTQQVSMFGAVWELYKPCSAGKCRQTVTSMDGIAWAQMRRDHATAMSEELSKVTMFPKEFEKELKEAKLPPSESVDRSACWRDVQLCIMATFSGDKTRSSVACADMGWNTEPWWRHPVDRVAVRAYRSVKMPWSEEGKHGELESTLEELHLDALSTEEARPPLRNLWTAAHLALAHTLREIRREHIPLQELATGSAQRPIATTVSAKRVADALRGVRGKYKELRLYAEVS